MSAPHALTEFIQKEAIVYLGRLDQMMADAGELTPGAAAFLTNARALRGSAAMTRLHGLADLASTSVARLLMDREITDQRLAQLVKQASITWSGAPAAPPVDAPAVIPIESLLYRGQSAVTHARAVRDELNAYWQRGALTDPAAHALLYELSDLLDLAVTT